MSFSNHHLFDKLIINHFFQWCYNPVHKQSNPKAYHRGILFFTPSAGKWSSWVSSSSAVLMTRAKLALKAESF